MMVKIEVQLTPWHALISSVSHSDALPPWEITWLIAFSPEFLLCLSRYKMRVIIECGLYQASTSSDDWLNRQSHYHAWLLICCLFASSCELIERPCRCSTRPWGAISSCIAFCKQRGCRLHEPLWSEQHYARNGGMGSTRLEWTDHFREDDAIEVFWGRRWHSVRCSYPW